MNEQILSGKSIFLAEDDTFLASVIIQKLETYGVVVTHFTHGDACLESLQAATPDLLLLDIHLPVLTGYQILDTLSDMQVLPQLPVIVISNSGESIEIDKIQKLGIRDYIIKANFSPDEVIRKIVDALESTPTTKAQSVPMEPLATAVAVPAPTVASNDFTSVAPETADAVEIVRVLVVEDDPLLRNMLSVKLANSHCPYMFSNDGQQAVELATQFEPQVIVLDLMLPGKDGFEVLAELKAHDQMKSVPVVIFSNKSGDNEKAKAIELGASAYRVKAMTDLNELIGELRRLAKATT